MNSDLDRIAAYQECDRDRGATATEYALLVGLIALVIIAGVTLFGANLQTFFSGLGSTVGTW
ncbi:Flp family type IVb pilin [Sinomonas sp. P47F7]|uniref:Flp family type IVb pilin n=1 Tax=Sinomonas sp. P47F7 TaxID=3410987 RepID=UPI003BF48187